MKKGTVGKIALGGLGLLAAVVGGTMLLKNKNNNYTEVELLDDVDEAYIDVDNDTEEE